ncbi:MAG: PVC-type heme-binding CxxCH protein [Balneolales bacterium]
MKKPPLPPEETLQHFQLEEGFRIELVAHDPMLTEPVAMDIDADGRLWVVEMPSVHPVHDKGVQETYELEQVPEGRVVVLEDSNDDGKMDIYRIFYEGLILPRAIKVLHDGILLGEPPHLWFIRDTTGDGKGNSREMVSNSYGDPDNVTVSSLPSGLMWGMDNWIHSANNDAISFRRIDGRWHTRPFQRLGQWSMTQDNWGRLYSSSNSWPLETNLVPYGYSERHPLFEVSTGINQRIAPNEPLWPAHVTGVNRGYLVGQVTRKDGTLRQNTAATTPVIYRGSQFGDEYLGNAFTPESAGNLIKRFIINGDPAEIDAEAHFAYEGREFLTSTDERFRPVNSYNAPDGSIYIVDMYRGLFEGKASTTDYLLEYTLENDLHKANGQYGRIYRIVRDDRIIDYNTPKFSEMSPPEVVRHLGHKNGWVRDQAQQLLVQCAPLGVAPMLEELIFDESANPLTRLHALWTLEGLSHSNYEQDRMTATALQALRDSHPRIRSSAVRILEPVIAQDSNTVLEQLAELMETETSSFVQLQMLASLGESTGVRALKLMADILNKHIDSPYFREMALTGVYQREAQLAEILRSEYDWRDEDSSDHQSVLESLAEAESDRPATSLGHLTLAEQKLFDNGRQLFRTCSTCHGPEGKGIGGIGTTLAGSEWVQGDMDALVRIVLNGFSGGAAERGEDVPGVMPAHNYISDEDLAAILTFLRQSWENDASPVGPEVIARIREEDGDRRTTWTPSKLRELLNLN